MLTLRLEKAIFLDMVKSCINNGKIKEKCSISFEWSFITFIVSRSAHNDKKFSARHPVTIFNFQTSSSLEQSLIGDSKWNPILNISAKTLFFVNVIINDNYKKTSNLARLVTPVNYLFSSFVILFFSFFFELL